MKKAEIVQLIEKLDRQIMTIRAKAATIQAHRDLLDKALTEAK